MGNTSVIRCAAAATVVCRLDRRAGVLCDSGPARDGVFLEVSILQEGRAKSMGAFSKAGYERYLHMVENSSVGGTEGQCYAGVCFTSTLSLQAFHPIHKSSGRVGLQPLFGEPRRASSLDLE